MSATGICAKCGWTNHDLRKTCRNCAAPLDYDPALFRREASERSEAPQHSPRDSGERTGEDRELVEARRFMDSSVWAQYDRGYITRENMVEQLADLLRRAASPSPPREPVSAGETPDAGALAEIAEYLKTALGYYSIEKDGILRCDWCSEPWDSDHADTTGKRGDCEVGHVLAIIRRAASPGSAGAIKTESSGSPVPPSPAPKGAATKETDRG